MNTSSNLQYRPDASRARIGGMTTYSKTTCIETGQITCSKPGPAFEMIRLALEAVGSSYEIVIPQDREWGALVNHTWTGLFHQLLNNDTDMTFPGIAYTEERSAQFEQVGWEILPLRYSFIFKPSALATRASFTWWKTLGSVLWLIFIAAGLQKYIKLGAPGENVVFGILTALYAQLFGILLMLQLIARQTAPFDSIESATAFFQEGKLNLICDETSAIYIIMNNPRLSRLKDVLTRNDRLKWAKGSAELRRSFSRDPASVVFGAEDDCVRYHKFGVKIICVGLRVSPVEPQYYTSYLRPGISPELKYQLQKGYTLVNQFGIKSAMIKKYFTLPARLQPSDQLDGSMSFTLNHCQGIFVALAIGLSLTISFLLIETIRAIMETLFWDKSPGFD